MKHPIRHSALSILLVLLSAMAVRAQGDSLSEDQLVPWVLMVDGDGAAAEDIKVGGRSIQVVRIPISYALYRLEDDGFGLRITLPVSFGFHELTADVVQEGQVQENLSTVTVIPGLEARLALPDRGKIKPFGEIGISSDLNHSESVVVYSLGARLLRPLRSQNDPVRIGALLKYSGSSLDGAAVTDGIFTGELGIERLVETATSFRGETLDLGFYAMVHHNFTRVILRELDTSTTELRRTAYEVGVSVGTVGEVRMLGFRLPRVGVSYRSSGNFKSWRINFGFPF